MSTEPDTSLALCMITRNVGHYVAECLASIIEFVDELSIVDSNSDDDTLEVIADIVKMRKASGKPFRYILSTFSAETHPEYFFKDTESTFKAIGGASLLNPRRGINTYTNTIVMADYAQARQRSYDQAQSRYKMWIDTDDIVIGAENIPTILKGMNTRNTNSALMTYDYDHDEKGQVTNKLVRTRITDTLAPTPARWLSPAHKTIGPIGTLEVLDEKNIKIVHRARELEGSESHRMPLRNYKIIVWQMHRMSLAQENIAPRMWFFLGNETRHYDRESAIRYLKNYISFSDWDEERSLSHIYIAQMLEANGDIEDAKSHFAAATTLFSKPEAHFGLARMAWYEKDVDECIRHHEKGRLSLFTVKDVLHYNPQDRYYIPAICASSAYIAKGMWKRAKRITEEGLKYAPDDAQLRGSLKNITDHYGRRNQNLDIIIHTARSLETWNANTPRERGIGGSETAVVHVSRELAARGHKVRVFCHCEGIEGIFEGVEYIPYDKFDYEKTSCDVFITSRRVATLIEGNVKARLKVIWMHDNHVGQAEPDLAKGLLRADLIMGVSRWHRDVLQKTYPFVNPTKMIATRNGIDKKLFLPNQPLPPKKQKLVFTSSPDRGLELALDLLPLVRKEVPDAELHIYYGFNNAIKTAEEEGLLTADEKKEEFKIVDLMMAKIHATEGAVMHGRTSQASLATELMESKVWFYPTWFQESSCISAMEAQAAGCVPVTTGLAALNETVHHGYLLKPPSTAEAYKETFVKDVVRLLTDDTLRTEYALSGRAEALKISGWDIVADEWENTFLDQLVQKTQ